MTTFDVPARMDAWVLRPDRHGPPITAFRRESLPVPEPGVGEVLVRVMAAGLNYSGVWAALGKPRSPFEWHGADLHVPGTDGAGVVWKVGANVTEFNVGDAVVIQPNIKCGACPGCAKGDDQDCDRYRIFGYETPRGTFAPFTIAKTYQLMPKPPHLTWEEAASYMVSLITSYHMLVSRAGLKRGERVLVWGAAGGLGVYAIQVATLHGARVIGIVSDAERAALAMRLGADAALDRNEFPPTMFGVHRATGAAKEAGLAAIKSVRARIRALLGGQDVDVVFEHVGESTFYASALFAGRRGRIVLSGATTGYDLTFDARYLWLQEKSILGAHSAPIAECRLAHDLIADRKIAVVLTQTFSYAEIAEANQQMFANKLSGNVACLVESPRPGLRSMPTEGFT